MGKINPEQVIQRRLVSSMGLDSYGEIMNCVRKTDVSSDLAFQRMFNGFYRVRRNAVWRDGYYRLFELVKQSGDYEFGYILDEIFQMTGNVEASFASKMLATLNPQMPIWDKYVMQNLGLEAPAQHDPNRMANTKARYAEIVNWYKIFLRTDNAKECLKQFDQVFPEYKWVSDVKKIDFFLWAGK